MFEVQKEPRGRGRGEVPWGFTEDPADPTQILPDLHQLGVLEEGLRYRLAGHSVRRVAAWIEARSGRAIHPSMIDRRLARERRAFTARQRALQPLPQC